MTKQTFLRRPLAAALLLLAAANLTACTSKGYRCPLEAGETPEAPTACSGMHDALDGAKRGAGSKTSVLTDEKGNLLPRGLRENKPAIPLSATSEGAPEPYRTANGEPLYESGRKFQVWTRAFVDADGNLHEGHHAWFATPDRWSYGSLKNTPGDADDNLMRPALPGTRPAGTQATPDSRSRQEAKTAPQAAALQKDKDKAALQNLSTMANSMAKPQGQGALPGTAATPAAPAITGPAVTLGN